MQPQNDPSQAQVPESTPVRPTSWPDSVVPQPPAPKKKPVLLIIILVLVLLVVGGAGAFYWWQSGQPKEATVKQSVALTAEQAEALYFDAIEQHMKTPYIVQKAVQTTGTGDDKLTINLEATSDFSDLKNPKTKLEYTTKDEKSSENSVALGREQIAIGPTLYAKVGKDATLNSPAYEKDKWYHVQEDNSLGRLLLDSFTIAEGVNTPLGQVLVGDFSEQDRTQLMTFIKDNNIYSLSNHKSETLNGGQAVRFTVKLNVKKSDDLNAKAAQILGIKNVLAGRAEGSPVIETFDAWIGKDDKKFKKVHFTVQESGKELGSSTFSFEYPTTSPNITKPAGVIEAPRQ